MDRARGARRGRRPAGPGRGHGGRRPQRGRPPQRRPQRRDAGARCGGGDLAAALDGIPLVAQGGDGWFVPHGLWRSAPGIELGPTERGQIRLDHLLRLLEQWRDAGEPAYLLRLEGAAVQLVTGEHLHLDVDRFDEHLRSAAEAEADGAPSVALEHNQAAVDLYRDQLHADLPESDWFALDREHYRARFVAAGVRAGQLLLSLGQVDRAQTMAHRALGVDPWAEEAYTVLVGAAMTRHDRSGALRMLGRCLDALEDLGVDPSASTQQLRRRLQPVDA